MVSRALLVATGVAASVIVALSAAGCSSLTRPNEITVAGDSAGDARPKPPPAGAPAGQARPAPAARP